MLFHKKQEGFRRYRKVKCAIVLFNFFLECKLNVFCKAFACNRLICDSTNQIFILFLNTLFLVLVTQKSNDEMNSNILC